MSPHPLRDAYHLAERLVTGTYKRLVTGTCKRSKVLVQFQNAVHSNELLTTTEKYVVVGISAAPCFPAGGRVVSRVPPAPAMTIN
jgi:hypothetical protein